MRSKFQLSLLAVLPLSTFLLLANVPSAWAQYGGQPGGMGSPGRMGSHPGGGSSTGSGDEKEEGPAEAAPDEEEKPAELAPTEGYAGQHRRRTQVLELDGYFRMRMDLLHQFDLGQTYTDPVNNNNSNLYGLPPFPRALECQATEASRKARCGSTNLASANLRLRLEPTVNITDQVRVMAQIDVLDNTIMGSTPDSLLTVTNPADRTANAPLSVLSNTQDPPEIGKNGYLSSVRAKRAWGEVDSEFGSLRFGRMPWHFGRGISYNKGDCQDCDGGTTVDRLMALTQIYGHQVALAWDFGAQGHTAGMVDFGRKDLEGPPLDLSQSDDVFELMAAITRIDSERKVQDMVAQGEAVLNYGLQLVYRSQSNEVFDLGMGTGPTSLNNPLRTNPLGAEELGMATKTGVNAHVFVPSLWLKLNWRALTLEFEGTSVLGKIGNAGPLVTDPSDKSLTLQQLGWVVSSELKLFQNAFFVGFESGGATGDQAENRDAYLNYRWKFVQQPLGDKKLTDFHFSPEYHVDEIFFRRILGTVTNAIYLKPRMAYWLDLPETRQIGISAAAIYSMAGVLVSTPGNALSYGLELDLGLNYRNPRDGFYAGFTYGVFWPFAALNRPNTDNLWTTAVTDASAAQVVRGFFGIRF